MMASGRVSRIKRPNTWLLRPACCDVTKPLTTWSRSLIASPLSTASLFTLLLGVTVLYAVGVCRRNIRSEAQALQCPQRTRVASTRSNGFRRSHLHPRPEGQRIRSCMTADGSLRDQLRQRLLAPTSERVRRSATRCAGSLIACARAPHALCPSQSAWRLRVPNLSSARRA